MDNKFYVSYEAARLLKEKGYDEETIHYYSSAGKLYLGSGHFNHNACAVNLSAPTKAEAIDWLESKGIIIGVKPYTAISFSYFILIYRKSSYDVIETNECFPTRLEAEEAAIIRTCELL